MRAMILRALSDLDENPEPRAPGSGGRDSASTGVQEFPLEAANQALRELKGRRIRGAKVLRIAAA